MVSNLGDADSYYSHSNARALLKENPQWSGAVVATYIPASRYDTIKNGHNGTYRTLVTRLARP